MKTPSFGKVAAILFSALAPLSLSAVEIWDPNGATAGVSVSGNWDTTTSNWTAVADSGISNAWTQADDAVFGMSATYIATLTAPITVGNLTATGTAGGLTIAGTSVNNLTLGSPSVFTITNASRTLTVSAPMVGGGSLTKAGNGILTLSGANTYSGGTTLSAGTVTVGVDTVAPGGVITSGPFGTGQVNVSAASTMSASGARVIQNPISLNIGLTIGGSAALTFTNGDFSLIGAGRTLTVNNTADTTIQSNLADDGAARTLTKAGTGRLIMMTGNTPNFLGGVTASAGTLVAGSDTPFPTNNANPITINSSTFDLNGFNVKLSRLGGNVNGSVLLGTNTLTAGNDASSAEFSGVMSGTGGYLKVGAISQVLSGTNTFSGGITITAGSLYLPTNAITGSPIALGAGTNTITITGTGRIGANRASPSISIVTNKVIVNTLTAGLDAASGGDFILTGQVSGPGSFVRTTQGSGFTVLAASNTFAGGVEIDARPFGMGDKNALGSGPFIIGNPTTPPGNTIELGCYNLDLIGSNAITNPVTINQDFAFGTRTAYAAFGLELSGSVTLPHTNTIFVTGTGLFKISGAISGSGGINKAGDNTLTLSANNTYTGPTIVSNATLALIGSATVTRCSDVSVLTGAFLDLSANASGSVLRTNGQTLGGSGTIIAGTSGSLNLSGGGTYHWNLYANSPNPGDFDQLTLTNGTLALGGSSKISINFTNVASSPDLGDPFWSSPQSWVVLNLMSAANPGNSDFKTVVNGVYTNGYFTTLATSTNVSLNFTPGPPPQPTLTSVIGAGTTSVTINFTAAIKGATYQVQYKNDLDDGSWSILGSVPGTGTTASITDTTSPAPAKRFYRIVIQ
jgi:autotransporter-associated beta strand protein